MHRHAALAQWEDGEGTHLEKSWGHRLQVHYYSLDDSDLHSFGNCAWAAKLPFHHLIFKPKDNLEWVCIYQHCHSWKVARVAHRDEIMVAKCAPVLVEGEAMVPIEGGGAVPWSLVRAATPTDLGINPNLHVIDVDEARPKIQQKPNMNIGHASKFPHHLHPQPEFTEDCLVQSLWNVGCKVQRESGPHWALQDGNRLLQNFSKRLKVVHLKDLQPLKKYVVHIPASLTKEEVDAAPPDNDHFVAVRTFENDFEVKDGKHVNQFDGSVSDFAYGLNTEWSGSEATWYELCGFPRGDGKQCLQASARQHVDRLGGMHKKRSLYSPETRRRILDRWGPAKYQRMRTEAGMALEREVEDESENLSESLVRVVNATEEQIALYAPLQEDFKLALRIVTLCVLEPIQWTRENDLLLARVAALLLSDVVAHADGVHRYRQGAYRRIEEIPNVCMVKMESLLSTAQIIFNHLKSFNVPRDMDTVFHHIEVNLEAIQSSEPVTSRDMFLPKEDYAAWALDACKGLRDCSSRFTSKSNAERIVDLLGTWTRVPRPTAPLVSVAFDDCAVAIDDDQDDPDLRVVQVPKTERICAISEFRSSSSMMRRTG